MGQRTQLLVIEKKPNNVTEKRLYHNQWGHGKRMFNGMMSIVSTILDGCSLDGDHEPLLKDCELANVRSFHDYFEHHHSFESLSKEIDKVDIDDFQSVKNLYDCLDNNDGGLVIEATWGKDKNNFDNIMRIRAGFLLDISDKDDGDFSQWVSPQRYAEQECSNCFTKEYLKSFLSLCKYADVEWMHEQTKEDKLC